MASRNGPRPSRLRISRDIATIPLTPNRAPPKVWAIAELREAILSYCDSAFMRKLAIISKEHNYRYNDRGWQELDGIRHLFSILDDSLGVKPTGAGSPVVRIPPRNQLDPYRIDRFLDRAKCVKVVKINSNPDRWIKWDGLGLLLPLVGGTSDRQVILPNAVSCIIHVGRATSTFKVAPLVKLMANPNLRKIWVKPFSLSTHPYCPVEDASAALSAVLAAQDNNPRLEWLGLFPETTENAPQLRTTLLGHFSQISRNLTHCTISAWALSLSTLVALSRAPLVRLEVQGRFAAESDDLSFAATLQLPEDAFGTLDALIVSRVPAQTACHLLATPRVLANIRSLRVEVFPVDDWFVDEHEMYAGVLNRAIEQTPHLTTLCLISSRGEDQEGYFIGARSIEALATKRLNILRLYRFTLEGLGFSRLLAGAEEGWGNLRQLAVMHQDLTPPDFVSLSQLPNLESLSGNISWPLGQREAHPPTSGFAHWLDLTSQFRFGQSCRSTSEDKLLISRICGLLMYMCPNGLSVHFDESPTGAGGSRRTDLNWSTMILTQLAAYGVIVPERYR
ncbi:hypothetical protein FRC11_008150 [Ceratobasidium sp. 423]|nr:hypothetical protein FRC11_008150 [Ceratobasidium sp. 423]